VLSCDVIIWDDNILLFYFSWKLHSLTKDRDELKYSIGLTLKPDHKRRKEINKKINNNIVGNTCQSFANDISVRKMY
jgi:hypothetical protein